MRCLVAVVLALLLSAPASAQTPEPAEWWLCRAGSSPLEARIDIDRPRANASHLEYDSARGVNAKGCLAMVRTNFIEEKARRSIIMVHDDNKVALPLIVASDNVESRIESDGVDFVRRP